MGRGFVYVGVVLLLYSCLRLVCDLFGMALARGASFACFGYGFGMLGLFETCLRLVRPPPAGANDFAEFGTGV